MKLPARNRTLAEQLVRYLIVIAALFGCTLFSPVSPPSADKAASPSPPLDCSADSVILSLRDSTDLQNVLNEYSVNYSRSTGELFLNLWFVDPDLDPEATLSNLEGNKGIAFLHASYGAVVVNSIEPCIAEVFDRINIIVVDSNYNGWFSASVPISALPGTGSPSEDQLALVARDFAIVYVRNDPPPRLGLPPLGSCNWRQSNERIHLHFDSARANVDFYFVGDEVSRKVTAQWDGQMVNTIDIGVVYASAMNVAQEIRCLYPEPDFLYVMVLEPSGNLVFFGRLPREGIRNWDFNLFEILYMASPQD